jgi:hypothetical protein
MAKEFEMTKEDKKVLLVEGINDCHVIKHISLKHDIY